MSIDIEKEIKPLKKLVSHYVKTWYSWLEHFIIDV